MEVGISILIFFIFQDGNKLLNSRVSRFLSTLTTDIANLGTRVLKGEGYGNTLGNKRTD